MWVCDCRDWSGSGLDAGGGNGEGRHAAVVPGMTGTPGVGQGVTGTPAWAKG